VDRQHWDKNMGFIFAFWDWMAGTLYAPKAREELTFGLGTEEDGGKWHSLRALYFLPFRQTFDRLRNRRARPPELPSEAAE
jgi:sterol desaturase/sphingolipid hydroxylase (fatty acid hydroxylase superfamily)